MESSGRISDWGYRSGEADGPFAGSWFHQYSWWNDWCQRRFDELWTDEADRVADDLADEYWFYWPWLIGRALITGAPVTYERILAFAKDEHRPGPAHIELNPHAISDQIATIGAFHVVRRRRSWPEPSAAVCPTCGQDFWNGDVRPWAIQAFGPVRYCMDCCFRVRNGDPRATWFEDEVKAALHDLRDAFGAIPAQGFSAGRVPHDGSPEERDRRIRALLAMPPVETIKRVLGSAGLAGYLARRRPRRRDVAAITWDVVSRQRRPPVPVTAGEGDRRLVHGQLGSRTSASPGGRVILSSIHPAPSGRTGCSQTAPTSSALGCLRARTTRRRSR